MSDQVIGFDLADVVDEGGKLIRTLAWGDAVEVVARETSRVKVRLTRFRRRSDGSVESASDVGYIKRPRSQAADRKLIVDRASLPVLKVDFVDVQQGDASVIETPSGRVVLVDGGDNQLFARYLASRFEGTTESSPKEIDCIVVSHGDADHFAGLTEIRKSETNRDLKKQLFIRPRRVFHNGLVKRPKAVPEKLRLGAIEEVADQTIIVGLEDDLRSVADDQLNEPFLAWKNALKAFTVRGAIEMRRLEKGDDAFGFLGDGIEVEVLAPILTQAGATRGLLFLGNPPKGPVVGHAPRRFRGRSASHTINGHSIVLRLTYGKWRFLYAGDLNEQAEEILTAEHASGATNLESEVLKVPHHGSAEFSSEFLGAVRPIISVVSSGDESEVKEYIHPRATLMSALGRHGRDGALVFVTELVAFFNVIGWTSPGTPPKGPPDPFPGRVWSKRKDPFFAFDRTAFGIVMVRCSRERLLVYTNSGKTAMKEAYAFEWRDGAPQPVSVLQI
jgi:beta-lactamase superfamily II metal-dependent hydrolase